VTRFVVVCIVSVVILVADFTSHFAIALGAGVLVGAGYFILAVLAGGGMRPIGLAAPHLMASVPKQPTDPNAGIGCGLAAAGIASSVVTNMHYPVSWRIFYAFCIGAGVAIALWQSWRGRNKPAEPTPPRDKPQ
jgi:hypothetical protein